METGLPFLLTIEFDGGPELIKPAARVQLAARKYGFRPLWLLGSESYRHSSVLESAARWQQDGAEVGVLLHAGRVPPLVELGRPEGELTLIDYPDSVIDEKLSWVTESLGQALPRRPISIRSVPAAVDDRYYAALVKHGFKIDLTVIPHVRGARDFTAYSEKVYLTPQGVFEIPRTVRRRERGLWQVLLGVPSIRSLRLSRGNFSIARRLAFEGLRGSTNHLDLRIAAEDWRRGEVVVNELERLLPLVQTGVVPVTAEEFLIRYKNEQLRKGPL
jgi:hypothetical protein